MVHLNALNFPHTGFKKILMALWSKSSQFHDIFCHDPEVMISRYLVLLAKSDLNNKYEYSLWMGVCVDMYGLIYSLYHPRGA